MTTQAPNRNNGNGHNGLKEVNLPSPGDMFTNQKMQSALQHFVERGEETEDLILRSEFLDYDHMIACMRLLRKSIHFHDPELQEMLMNIMAGVPAIHGKRIDTLKDAVIGKHSQEKKDNFFQKFKDTVAINDGGKSNE